MSTSPPPAATPPRRRMWLVAGVVALVAAAAGVGGYLWWQKTRLPGPGSAKYEEYVDAFDVGLAAMDVGVGDVAEKNLSRTVELVPQEPAGWANRGLFYLRTRQFPQAAADLGRAEKLAPDSGEIQSLLGLLDEQQGKFPEAASRFRNVVEKNPKDVEAIYALARLVDKEQKADADAEYQKLMEQALAVRPDNLLLLGERLQVATRRGDRPAVEDTLARFRKMTPGWKELTRTQFAELEKELANPAARDVGRCSRSATC